MPISIKSCSERLNPNTVAAIVSSYDSDGDRNSLIYRSTIANASSRPTGSWSRTFRSLSCDHQMSLSMAGRESVNSEDLEERRQHEDYRCPLIAASNLGTWALEKPQRRPASLPA